MLIFERGEILSNLKERLNNEIGVYEVLAKDIVSSAMGNCETMEETKIKTPSDLVKKVTDRISEIYNDELYKEAYQKLKDEGVEITEEIDTLLKTLCNK